MQDIFQLSLLCRGPSDRACAQVGAVAILSLEENKGKTAYFGAVNNARFKRKVVPGDKLKMECEIIKKKDQLAWERLLRR